MGLFGWIFYIIMGIIIFFLMNYLDNRFSITKIDKIVLANIIVIIISEFLFKYSIKYTENIFLIFVFILIVDIIYSTYVIDHDFFDKDNNNILFYVGLIISGFIVNQEFINRVSSVFLTGEELRVVLWLLIIVYIYNFSNSKKLFEVKDKKEKKFMSTNSILNNYAKFKYAYYDECDNDNKDISNILYAIMIYEDNKRNKFLRRIDNFKYKINGKKSKLGIMQVESKKFISDSESIELVSKKIIKIYNSSKKKDINSVFDKYYGYNNEDVKYIFEIIKKF